MAKFVQSKFHGKTLFNNSSKKENTPLKHQEEQVNQSVNQINQKCGMESRQNLYPVKLNYDNFIIIKKCVANFNEYKSLVCSVYDKLNAIKLAYHRIKNFIDLFDRIINKQDNINKIIKCINDSEQGRQFIKKINECYESHNKTEISTNICRNELIKFIQDIKNIESDLSKINEYCNLIKNPHDIIIMYTDLGSLLISNPHQWNIYEEISSYKIWIGQEFVEICSKKTFEVTQNKYAEINDSYKKFDIRLMKHIDLLIKVFNNI